MNPIHPSANGKLEVLDDLAACKKQQIWNYFCFHNHEPHYKVTFKIWGVGNYRTVL